MEIPINVNIAQRGRLGKKNLPGTITQELDEII